MMRKTLPFLFVFALLTLLPAGCGSNSSRIVTCACPVVFSPVSITITDDPPAGVSVLFFQVSLTAATLSPASATGNPASLLYNNQPIQVDVTQLQALSAFLNTANVPPATYNSLNLTFASPQLVIYNRSDSSLGSSCAVGSICQLTPSFDNSSSSLSFTSSPLPVTLNAYSPLSLLIDFHLNKVIQSDLSVNLGVTNGVTVSELPPASAAPHFGLLTGTVLGTTPSLNQFTLQTQWGGSFVIGTTSSTAFNNFPSSACTVAGFGCVAQGQVVQVQISDFTGYSNLTASQVTYVQAANTQTVQGTIIQAIPATNEIAGYPPSLVVILHSNPASATGFPLGGIADVNIDFPSATYSIDSNGFTMPSGLDFSSGADLMVGQNVTLTVEPGTLSTTGSGAGQNGWGPPPSISFTASAVELEPSQMTGSITAIDSGATSFTMGVAGPFFAPWPPPSAVSSYDVLTTSQTSFTGFNPDTFSGLATSDVVSVNGWLFPPSSSIGGSPSVAAQSVVMRPGSSF